ncbi:hypothetical protein SAMN05216276_103158 [Streptosporangium subroseum]|uniref:Uncharacterized protein n=1 Tax=Streptosporangium subroseum TaxID=106412 RepID=A0A239LAU3_9ACTN|nr:hypothetical protein SAMN05216276_103158 [Streptosporangium subroseum]
MMRTAGLGPCAPFTMRTAGHGHRALSMTRTTGDKPYKPYKHVNGPLIWAIGRWFDVVAIPT